jgi:hypothetical protein
MAIAWGTVLFLVTLLPYVIAYLTTPGGKVFNGFFFVGDDATTYIAKMREGAEGAWGWTDSYISLPVGEPVLVHPFYIFMGKLASPLHLSLYALYHLARFSGAIALVFAVRRLAHRCLPPGRVRRMGVLLALLGAGAGYLLALVAAVTGQTTFLGQPLDALDLHVPELSGFFSVLTFPHFAWAAALMAMLLVAVFDLVDPRPAASRAGALVAGIVAALGIALIHPQMLAIVALLALLYLVVSRPPAWRWVLVAVPFLFCIPLFAYYQRIVATDPVVSEWTRQWQQGALGPMATAFALGLPFCLATVGAVRSRLARSPKVMVLTAWVVIVLATLYIPSPFHIQRRFLEGLYIPIGFLAALGLEALTRNLGARGAGRAGTLALGFSTITSFLVLAVALLAGLTHAPYIYLDQGEADAMDWLAGARGSALAPAAISAYDTGLFIPARSGLRVYAGHYSETLDNPVRRQAAESKLRAGGAELVTFMRDQGVTYLFVGPRERAAGVGPISADLRQVYDEEGVQVYRLGVG